MTDPPLALPDTLRELVERAPLAHVATVNQDGSPHLTVVWVGIDDAGVLVSGHLGRNQKVVNLGRDPRVTVSMEAPRVPGTFLAEYAAVRARAEVVTGGAAALLRSLGRVYVSPDFDFPLPPDPPPGYVVRYHAQRITGVGPWAG